MPRATNGVTVALRRAVLRALRVMACAVGAHAIARWLHRRQLLIVAYHGLLDDRSGRRSWLLVPRERFAAQLDYLARHYRIVPIDVALGELRSGRLRRPTACVTFDDGYRSNLTLGLPELAARRVPATIYLATGLVGTGRRVWTTEIESMLERAPQPAVEVPELGIPRLPLRTRSQRAAAVHRVKERVKELGPGGRASAIDALRRALGADGAGDDADFAMLDWSEVRTLGVSGLVTFGGHTINHEILSNLDDAGVEVEVGGSVAAVRALGPAASATFAYPNGRWRDFDQRAVAAARAAGCTAAVTTVSGLNPPDTEPFALRRIVVGADTSLPDFKLRTSGLVAAVRRRLGLPLDA